MSKRSFRVEKVPLADGVPLRLAFGPKAIRAHFPENGAVAKMTDEDLLEIGREALEDDELVEALHSVLVRAVCRLHPDVDEIELE